MEKSKTQLQQAGEFIKNTGFPIVAAIAMFWMCHSSIQKLEASVNTLNSTFVKFTEEKQLYHREVVKNQETIIGKIDGLKGK